MNLRCAWLAGLVWMGAVGAELPPRLAGLAPAGAKVISGRFTAVAGTAVAGFEAEKSIDAVRKVHYQLDLKAFDTSTPIWQMKGPALRRQMEMKMEGKRKGLAPESANMGMFTAEAVKEAKKGWGVGVYAADPAAPAAGEGVCGLSVRIHGDGGGSDVGVDGERVAR